MMVLQQMLIVDNLLKKRTIWGKISLDAVWWMKEACKCLNSWRKRKIRAI